MKLNHRFDHVDRSGIERGFRAARLAGHHADFGEPAQHHVPRLQVIDGLQDRHARDGDRHVHHHPLVEWQPQRQSDRSHGGLKNQPADDRRCGQRRFPFQSADHAPDKTDRDDNADAHQQVDAGRRCAGNQRRTQQQHQRQRTVHQV